MIRTLVLTFILIVTLQPGKTIQAQDYIINPQNVLEINVYEEENLSIKARVNSEHKISYPLIGEIDVYGLTVSKLENKLTELLKDGYLVDPQINIFIMEFSPIYIYGEVKKPGAYSLKGSLTVVEAISLSGGLTIIADPRKIKILRYIDEKEKIIKVNLNKILKGKNRGKDIQLLPRDVIIVQASFF